MTFYFFITVICVLQCISEIQVDYLSKIAIMCRRMCLEKGHATPIVMVLCYAKANTGKPTANIVCVSSEISTEDKTIQTVPFQTLNKSHQHSNVDKVPLKRKPFMILYGHTLSWSNASIACQAQNMSLLIIDSHALNTESCELVRKYYSSRFTLYAKEAWIGLRYVRRNNTFLWTDNSTLNYSLWASSEPSHRHPRSGKDEDCGAIDATTCTWNDENCGKRLAYVCEASVV